MTVAKRREREQSVRRELILATARRLFESKGFELTTVEEIAAQAELGKGTIYSYFKSKEQIYIAILEQGLDLLKERIEAVMQNPVSATDALHRMFDVFVEYHRERKGFLESLFLQVDQQQYFRLGELVGGLKNKALVWVELVAKILRWGIERGEFKQLDVHKTAQILIGMVLGLILQHGMGQYSGEISEYRETLLELVLDGIKG
jgi:TetR/AcrR family fatty acid metabolism transcriptional regulator